MKRRTPWSLARLFVILVLAVVMVSMMGTVAFAQEPDNSVEKECYLKGDMNADGEFNPDDAIHTLYHAFFGDEDYPIKQDCNVDGDLDVDPDDAIELLYMAFFGDDEGKFGKTVHDYYDPAWSWEETAEGVVATVTVQCACGDKSHSLEADVAEGETVPATCTAAGSQAYTATVSDGDDTFTATYTKVIPAAGHVAEKVGYDGNAHYDLCACGEKLNVVSHNWEADGEASEATCLVASVQNYKCSCGATKSEELGFAEHAYKYVEDVLVEGQTCRYAKKHVCEDCGDTKLTDEYDKHDYISSIKEATCQEDGEKIYKCSKCGAVDNTKTEIIAKGEDKHIWNDGVEAAGVITYTCTVDGCGATKTAVTTSDDGTVSKDALQNADQLEVGGATLEMEESVKESLDDDKEIQITVETMDVADAEAKLENALTEEQKEQIGENKIYDFNMSYSDGQKVDFDGWITVSLPYTLAEGEDIDAIDVWYIADDGTLEKQTATYSNGYVTFKTNHFSYYTVTRLTPAERCERYGHIWTDANKAATCTADGYTKQVCQRCAAEKDLVVIEKTGHNYKSTETPATCDKFGSVVETCANCGHTKSTVTPAKGHAMELTETVNATCNAAGKKVYTCANGCGHTTEEAIPQLTHSYKKDETKTVAATCTAGGYDIHVCEYCGDEIKKNETTPIGHKYGDEVWNWTDEGDDSEATLTLTCTNGCGSTKEFEAKVTVKKATCLGDGALSASVFFNNKTYTDDHVGSSATGHKPGSEWSTTEKEHYYKCEGCDEKLEAATHDFGDGVVTKEPTCTEGGVKTYTCAVCGYVKEESVEALGKHSFGEGVVTKAPTCTEGGIVTYTCEVCGHVEEEVVNPSGKHSFNDGVVTKEPTCAVKGTKVYTCTVCGFTREDAIAATGNHNYVNGSCSVCGKEETDCNHYRIKATLLDISAFDICDGFELYEFSCECGKNRYLQVENATCDLETISESQTAWGITEVMECTKCGLHVEAGQKVEFCADPCRAEAVYWGKLTMGDATVAEFSAVMDTADHIAHIVKEETKITDKGMCELIVHTISCDCGKVTQTQVNSACEWSYKGDVAICTVCGAQLAPGVGDMYEDGCMYVFTSIYRYFNKDGEEVYTHIQENIEYNHDYQVTNYELYGDSCEDGVWIEYTCEKCGEVYDEYYEGGNHPMVVQTVTDLTDANICAFAHIQYSCACGMEKREQLAYREKMCQWAWVKDPNAAPDTETETAMCSVCGAIRTNVITRTEKDENCKSAYTEIRTYKDKDGNVLAEGVFHQISVDHNVQISYDLQGESCEDGVTVTEYCVDCGMNNTWTIEHHELMRTEYDLSELGLCGGWASQYKCPCGQECWAEIHPWGCEWQSDDGETYKCRNCGVTWELKWERVVIDPCHSQTNYVYIFKLADGTEVLRAENIERHDDHRWIAELTLLEGSETCWDGYHVNMTCLTCGQNEEFNERNDHATYPIRREMVSQGQLCGDVEMVTYSCACGAEGRTEARWHNGECNFVHTDWGEEEDSYIYTCTICGAVRYERNYHEQVPGGTECQRQHRYVYTYMTKDGEELFVETGIRQYEEHDWIWDLELMVPGSTCENGVIVRQVCAKCGLNEGEDIIYYHESFYKEYDLSELGFCGGWAYIESCACGETSRAEVNSYCDMRHEAGEGWYINTCVNCGNSIKYNRSEEIIDACHRWYYHSYKFSTKEDIGALKLEYAQLIETHNWEYTFKLMGETCEDGVIISGSCTECGESHEYETYDHENFELARYIFADYGWCEGVMTVYGCACGEYKDVEYWSGCTWYGMGGYGGGVNQISEKCNNCGMKFTMAWSDDIVLDVCHKRVDYTFTFAEGDVMITAESIFYQEDHRPVSSLTLYGENCEDGFRVEQYCVDCKERLGSWGGNGHETHIIDRTAVTVDAKTCGEVERLTYSCACGQESGITYRFDGCEFYEYYDQERQEWIVRCDGCGTEQRIDYVSVPVEGETCKVERTETWTYLQNGEAILSYTVTEIAVEHNEIASPTLMNPEGTCDDGWIIYWHCQDCGADCGRSGVNYGCRNYVVARELIASKDQVCGNLYMDYYSCACGASQGSETHWEDGYCQFQDVWSEDQGRWIYTCVKCGVERQRESSRERIEGTTCEYLYNEVYDFYRDGNYLFGYTRNYRSVSHNEVYQLTLVNPEGTCDDGYTRSRYCVDCGYTWEADPQVYYGCEMYTVQRELLGSSGSLCGDLYRYTNRCACGKNTETYRSWWYGSCDFEDAGWNEKEQCRIYTCTKCGAYYKGYNESGMVEGSNCQGFNRWEDHYYNAAGDYLFTDSGSNIYHQPTWVWTMTLVNPDGTCDDGYTRRGVCYYCGEEYVDDEIYYGCDTRRVEIQEIVPERDDVCGPIELSIHSCACGSNSYWSIDHDCSFSWVKDDETGASIFKCNWCGLMYSDRSEYIREPFSCLRNEDVTRVYFLENGDEIIELGRMERSFVTRRHQYVYDNILVDGATSCEDGYYWIERCVYCDYTHTNNDIRNDHNTRAIAYYNLEDYGKCGGYLEERSCACGENHYWNYYFYGDCSFEYTGNVNEYGISERYCKSCNTYVYMDTRSEFVREECCSTTTLYARMVRDGVTLLDLVKTYEQDSHTEVAVGYEGGCEDGSGVIYYQCYYCGEQRTAGWSGGHLDVATDILDLDAIGENCGGYIKKHGCSCGYYSGLWWYTECDWRYGSWEPVEINGVTGYTRDRICENCGLWIRETYHEEESDEMCRYNRIYTYEFWMAETLVKVYETVEHYESHNYELTSYWLKGETCDDGVGKIYTCSACGDSYETTSYSGHEQYADENQSIDLTQHGSVCGCTLQYYSCACGQYQSYELDGECDLGVSYPNVWVEGALSDGQYTTEGWRSFYSNAYIYTCAVTEPQCGLKIRMAYVWLAEDGCKAVQYQIWQLGYKEIYDEATGETTYTWDQEIMIPTGEVRTYHDYEHNYDYGDGNHLIESYICKDCGSSYVEENTYVDGEQIRYERHAVNTLDNGERKQWDYIIEYEDAVGGYRYVKLERESYIYADGSEWWSQTERTHVTDGGCRFIVTNTNSNGGGYSEEFEHQSRRHTWEWEKYPTCSQPGVEVRYEICTMCGETVDVQKFDRDPYGHDWTWDYYEQHYYCYRCDLENANGADGTIVVQDLTAEYGNETNYVVGYWNQGNGNFTIYASVILDEVTDGNDELVLTDIEFNYLTVETDGINAISASQSLIQDAAKTAMAEAGYTGSYAIRIAFVPADGDGTLDYAITFDSQLA